MKKSLKEMSLEELSCLLKEKQIKNKNQEVL